MANYIDTINVGGIDFEIKDKEARKAIDDARVVGDYDREKPNQAALAWPGLETRPANVFDNDYAVGGLFTWASYNCETQNAQWYPRGMMMRATQAVHRYQSIIPGVNCEPISLLDLVNNVRVYVGADGKLHFVDATGADTVLPFSKGEGTIQVECGMDYSWSQHDGDGHNVDAGGGCWLHIFYINTSGQRFTITWREAQAPSTHGVDDGEGTASISENLNIATIIEQYGG